jgi:hypothetical protein
MADLTRIRIFVSSPGDVEAERAIVKSVAQNINSHMAIQKGFLLDVIEWEERVVPWLGSRPQEVINPQIGDFDLFIGIMWGRFGTPTERFGSGTEEEFELAYSRFRQEGSPRMLFYFCEASPKLASEEDIEQYQKVFRFKRDLSASNLIVRYMTRESFEGLVRDHLTQHLAGLLPDPQSSGPPPPDPDQYTVFIASARDVLEPRCYLLSQELKRLNFEVYHPAPGPVVKEMISKAKVCVHFLDGVADDMVDHQLDLSCALAQRQILWLPTKIVLSDENPDPYIRKLHDVVTREGKFELELMQASDPVHDIVERLVDFRKQDIETSIGKRSRCIFFNIQQKDAGIRYTDELFQYLREKKNIEPLMNREDPDKPTMREFDEKVSKSKAFVVFYGTAVDRIWMRDRLKHAVRLVYEKNCKVKKFAVILTPPPREGLEPIELPLDVRPLWIDQTEGFNESKLEDLVSVFESDHPEVAKWESL